MPIKDLEKRREYQRELMRKKRQGLTENVSPEVLDPNLNVSPVSPNVSPDSLVSPVRPAEDVRPIQDNCVKPEPEELDPVRPAEIVRPVSPQPAPVVRPCPLNHYSLTELFRQATEQVKSAWIKIRSQGGADQCYNCHNSQRNHQLAINLLERYWAKSKRLERGREPM